MDYIKLKRNEDMVTDQGKVISMPILLTYEAFPAQAKGNHGPSIDAEVSLVDIICTDESLTHLFDFTTSLIMKSLGNKYESDAFDQAIEESMMKEDIANEVSSNYGNDEYKGIEHDGLGMSL